MSVLYFSVIAGIREWKEIIQVMGCGISMVTDIRRWFATCIHIRAAAGFRLRRVSASLGSGGFVQGQEHCKWNSRFTTAYCSVVVFGNRV